MTYNLVLLSGHSYFHICGSSNDDVTKPAEIQRGLFGIIMEALHSLVMRKQAVAFAVRESHCTALQEHTLLSSEERYRSGKGTKVRLYVALWS
jgi:hypothetical protein